jgi:LL-diaminopimelate aminotransferase
MFVWAPIPSKYTNSYEFCMDLMEKTGVICTPGSAFGTLGEGYVRFALVLPVSVINEALNRIKDSGILF